MQFFQLFSKNLWNSAEVLPTWFSEIEEKFNTSLVIQFNSIEIQWFYPLRRRTFTPAKGPFGFSRIRPTFTSILRQPQKHSATTMATTPPIKYIVCRSIRWQLPADAAKPGQFQSFQKVSTSKKYVFSGTILGERVCEQNFWNQTHIHNQIYHTDHAKKLLRGQINFKRISFKLWYAASSCGMPAMQALQPAAARSAVHLSRPVLCSVRKTLGHTCLEHNLTRSAYCYLFFWNSFSRSVDSAPFWKF